MLTQLDRIKPGLNEATPGDPRDTNTPMAMMSNVRALALQSRLSALSRERLTGRLLGSRTGERRLRAGLPPGWRIGDKTDSSGHGTTNDVGIIWPPARPPLVTAVLLTESLAPIERREAALAAVGRVIASSLDI